MRAVMLCRLCSLSKCRGMVGAAGFEPATWSTQNSRATRLRYAPAAAEPRYTVRFGPASRRPRGRSAALIQLEHGPQQVLHRHPRRLGRRVVVAGVRVERDARVLVAEDLSGFGVDDGAGRFLLERAGTHALRIGRDHGCPPPERIV